MIEDVKKYDEVVFNTFLKHFMGNNGALIIEIRGLKAIVLI